ncbi:MAG: flagellar hook-associated protein FlgL [Methyloversatilis sp.]|nr:flagellar hook-associated protein FlgL [Methyloversatilis sp.]
MRISTNTIYETGTAGLVRQSSELFRTQQQMSTGKRVLAPSDDPVASATALEIDQTKAMNDQHAVNRRDATSALGFAESQISTAGDLIASIRERLIQAGNGALSDSDLKSIATDIRGSFAGLMGVANSRDAFGDFLFSGYRSDTQPFAGSIEAGVTYAGDDGQRESQVGSARRIAVSDSGSTVFMRMRTGNGDFTMSPGAGNTGSAVSDLGSVTSGVDWNAATNGGSFNIVFDVTNNVTTYDIIDNTSGNSMLTGAAPGAAPYPRTYVEGDTITLASQGAEPAFDLGARFSITGSPATGDSFSLDRSATQSVFETISDVVMALEGGTNGNPVAIAALNNTLSATIGNIDQAQEALLTVRSRIGARAAELDALNSLGADVDLQFQAQLADLRELNYTEAISRLTQQQTYLQAAQQSFLKVSGLSLFNFI